jgi:adenosylcobinamide-phosphate synthase
VKRTYLLPAAFLLDYFAGDPEWFPHPVRLMGLAITHGERLLRGPDDSPTREFFAGAALTAGVVVSSYCITRTLIQLAYRRSRALGYSTEILLAWTCLAARNLQQEAQAVSAALEQDDLPLARTRLARIVGRDTHALDAREISRALIETLAESASDGIVAPIVYLAAGGVPLGMAYKAVNTLDSMIGHRDAHYQYFGKTAARLDDAANYAPSRITALSVVAASALPSRADPQAAWESWRRDGGKHKSPNAGQPEAAMSGALGVRLGGDNYYGGELGSAPVMGEQFPRATPAKARHAIRLTTGVAMIGLAVGILIAATSRSRRSAA